MEMIQKNWKQLTIIQVAGALCVPVMMVGRELINGVGLKGAIAAILIGNAILFLLALVKGSLALNNRLSTPQQAAHYFGSSGVYMLAGCLIISMTGWFAVQLNIMSVGLNGLMFKLFGWCLPLLLINAILGGSITLAALQGITAIKKIANLIVPILILTIIVAILKVAGQPSVAIALGDQTLMGATLLVIATALALIIDIPTYYRFSKSKFDTVTSLAILFLIALPLIECIGIFFGLRSSCMLVDAFMNAGGIMWQSWVALFLLLTGWATNNANLYSASVSIETIVPSIGQRLSIMIAGCCGIIISCMPLLDRYALFLEVLGIMAASIGGVIVTRVVFKSLFSKTQPEHQTVNILASASGMIMGLFGVCSVYSLTGYALLDAWVTCSMIVAGVSCVRLLGDKN